MKAGFALLVDDPAHNLMRNLAIEIDAKYQTGLIAARLLPHISLKQPFPIQDLSALAGYFDQLAATLRPVPVALKQVEVLVSPDENTPGIVWLDVEESNELRDLHNRLNRELAARFENTAAPFDGPEYHFHATVTYAGQPAAVYRQIHSEYDRQPVGYTFTANRIGLFYSIEAEGKAEAYVSYRIYGLGSQ
ncbi:MAG: 2'-5' RNA ligase family protein [Anaerolineae bacterium]